jgi:ubiquinone/menaquinone biosynthesis C-methylase UbiE
MTAFLGSFEVDEKQGRLLDLGAGSKPYEPLYREYFPEHVSVDVPQSRHDIARVDVLASADSLPFESDAFTCIICTEVLEHCAEPGAVLHEIYRILTPGGRAFVTTPFLLPLHEMPFDFYRFTPSSLEYLSRRAGLIVERLVPRGSYLSVFLAINQMPLTKTLTKLQSKTRLPFAHPYNPLVFGLVVLPQKGYIRALGWFRRHPGSRLTAFHDKLTYYASGYVTVLKKPVAASAQP